MLDVDQIARWAGCVGSTAPRSRRSSTPSTTSSCPLAEPRAEAYRELDRWLDRHLGVSNDSLDHLNHESRTGLALNDDAHFDLTIIGTGSGNSILDERYEDKKVAICEQGTFGGTCLNVGCIPTKMFVYAAEVAATVRDSNAFGVDAHIDGVRWPDIVSRVFGRIDPIALGGETYRRSSPNVTVFDSHTRFGPTRPDGRYALRTEAGDEFTSDQVVIAAGRAR